MDGRNRSSFWATLPGILTGLAGIVTAVATLVAVGLQLTGSASAGDRPPPAPPAQTANAPERQAATVSWAEAASRLCDDTLREVRALGTPATAAETVDVLRRTIDANWRLHAALRAIPVGAGDEERVEALLASLAEANDHGERILTALGSFDQATATAEWNRLLGAEREFDAAAIGLGASACAQDG